MSRGRSDRAPTVDVLRRRSVSVGGVAIGLLVAPLLAAAVPVLALVDLLRARPALPSARMAAFGIWYLGWEAVAVLAGGALWLATGFGRAVPTAWSRRAHHRLQVAWVTSLLGAARRVLDIELRVDGAQHLADGPLVVLCRHASMIDTLVPAKLLFDAGLRVRYVLKDELLWDPALDIIGHRLPNAFIDRTSDDPLAEAAQIRALAETAGPDDALVIFPEGTRWSPAKRERALAQVAERDPERLAVAEGLTRTLPPRARGTLALLEGRPDADVIVVSHTGLEGLAGPREALRLLPLRHPVRVQVRRIPRSEVPDHPEGQRAWLDAQWQLVDGWVRSHRALDTGSGDRTGA